MRRAKSRPYGTLAQSDVGDTPPQGAIKADAKAPLEPEVGAQNLVLHVSKGKTTSAVSAKGRGGRTFGVARRSSGCRTFDSARVSNARER